MATLSVSFGYKEPNATYTSTPSVLYVGFNKDEAVKAIHEAGAAGKIKEGRVLQHLDSCVTFKHVFE